VAVDDAEHADHHAAIFAPLLSATSSRDSFWIIGGFLPSSATRPRMLSG
jgi:hypothetical protein